uniref:Uncharacterized protein n=1 Tax=Octopus bimaculoides TaxID=37653 RepID=A0A0L8GQA1_OCTBM
MFKLRSLTRNWLIKRIQANNLLYVLLLVIFILFLIQATHEKFKPWQRRGPQHVMHSKTQNRTEADCKRKIGLVALEWCSIRQRDAGQQTADKRENGE